MRVDQGKVQGTEDENMEEAKSPDRKTHGGDDHPDSPTSGQRAKDVQSPGSKV